MLNLEDFLRLLLLSNSNSEDRLLLANALLFCLRSSKLQNPYNKGFAAEFTYVRMCTDKNSIGFQKGASESGPSPYCMKNVFNQYGVQQKK